MSRTLCLLMLFMHLFGAINAQEYTIKGRILTAERSPLALATILLQDKDTVLVTGTSSDDDGYFTFKAQAAGTYLISGSYIQNSTPIIALNLSEDTDIGNLILQNETQALEGVTVTYQKPRLERQADRLIFNVANTAVIDGSIWDLLKATPSVNILQGGLSVKGNSAVTILINGRRVNLPRSDIENLLSGSSASSVAAIEVITNPPAKYSAEDGVLIDIKMSKNLIAGYNGAIYNRYRQGVFAKHNLGTDHYFKGKKTEFSINYGYGRDKWLTRFTDITNFSDNGVPSSSWEASQDRIRRQQRHTLSAFFDYTLDDRNTLSISTINSLNPKIAVTDDSQTLITTPLGDLASSFITNNSSAASQNNAAVYADWVHTLKKKGAQVSVNAHYTYYDSEKGQDVQTDFFSPDDLLTNEIDFTTQQDQDINLYSAQIDYRTPITEKTTLETGLRYAGIASESTISQEGFDRGQAGIDPTEAGVFDYDESIYAGYLSLNTRWDKWQLRTGLRGEQTETLGVLDIADNPNENAYFELFPTLSVQFTQNDKNSYSFRYNRRIERPRYDNINPFQYFQNNFTIAQGNPELRPAIATRLALGYTFDDTYTLELIYDNVKDPFNEQVFQDNDNNLLLFLSENLAGSYSYGLDFTFNKDLTSFWNSYVLLAYWYKNDTFRDLETDLLIDNDQHSWIARTNQSFTLLEDKSLYLDVSFFYISPTVRGNVRVASRNSLGVFLRKNFWDRKARLSLGLADIFNQSNFFSTRRFLDQDNSTFSRRENRLLSLNFRYTFGNRKIRDNYKRKGTEERNRL